MEPPGGIPPDKEKDRDKERQFRLRPQSSQQHSAQKPGTLSLNLANQQQQQSQPGATTIATSPLLGSGNNLAAGSTSISVTSATTPTLASAATAISATTQAATAFSGSSIGHNLVQQHGQHSQHYHQAQQAHQQSGYHPPLQANSSTGSTSVPGTLSSGSGGGNSQQQQQSIEKLSRPMAFDKMESLVREMQDPEHGVPVRQQKMFLTSIPYAFMGYDLIEWLMDRLAIEESEALNIANQLCLHGYFFPVNDTKTLTVKDDSSLYRFQTPYYWPWQHKAPDNVEYAIYLVKRSLRNKQRHALEDYEAEALASLHKNLKGKWDFISMQAEEQVRLAKERKKGDKIVGDSQERAYWRVHRPPPGQFTPLEPCPVPSRDRQGTKHNKKKTVEDMQREVDYLQKSLNRTRMKMSQACESLVSYSETFTEFDFFLQPVLPSNPWVTEDITFWQLNNTFVDIPTEKRVRRWAISIEELVSDPTGLQEFTSFLEKEYSHENIRFWIAVNRLRRSAHSQVAKKVQEIYEEFLKPGAPCEINIDGKTMESVLKGLKNPSRFTFDSASEHIYMLLLKKDCYPRFIRSDHYKRLLECGIQPSHKKRFFNFGGVSGAKKKMTAALSGQGDLTSTGKGASVSVSMMQAPPPGSLSRRRGSDRSLTGSAHELAVIGVIKDASTKVPHSHSQSNLSEIPYSETIYRGDMPQLHSETGLYAGTGSNRKCTLCTAHQETAKPKSVRLETTVENASSAVCPWDMPDEPPTTQAPTAISKGSAVKLSVCPWEQSPGPIPAAKSNSQRLTSTSSDISDVSDRFQRNLGIRHQNTVDSGESSMKRLMPNFTEQRRASISYTPGRSPEATTSRAATVNKTATPSPTVSSQSAVESTLLPFVSTIHAQSSSVSIITRDPPSDVDIDEELHHLSISERNSESSTSELPNEGISAATPTPTSTHTPAPTPPPLKVTPPPPPQQQPPPPPDNTVAIETQTIVDNPSESPQSDVFNAAVVDEVNAEVQDVQIELIEAPALKEHSRSVDRIQTPTIQIEDANVSLEENVVPSPTLKSLRNMSGEESVDLEIQMLNLEQSTGNTPPRPATVGPMEEEAHLHDNEEGEEALGTQEELSPTTEEYQEGIRFGGDSKDDCSYEIVDTDERAGYIPPAPTPAPSMAPLAELDIDTVDDDYCCESMEMLERPSNETVIKKLETRAEPSNPPVSEETRKRRKKRSSDGKKMSSLEEKEKDKAGTSSTSGGKPKPETDRNAICPWEDENVSASDGTFVKTYATLGYL